MIRVAASYAVIAWLLLQIADVTFGPLGVPNWAMTSLIVAAVLGFPVAVALAWFYEAGDRGIALDTAGEGAVRPVSHGLRRYADFLIIGVLLVAVAVLLVRQSNLGGTGTDNPAVAVLPFRNLNTAAEGEVLAMGIAESVLHQLANLSELDVISRTSSFTFGDRKADAREIGRQLGARYLLEGTVQSDRTRMRVTTQLIDTETGADIWSMRFDRPPGDIFEVQDEIAVQVTQALELSLDANAKDRLTEQGTENLDAYFAFMQGRTLQANNRVIDMKEAIGHFERAIKADPDFADAYVNQAAAELFVAEFEVTDDRQARFERALRDGKELIGKALEIDPEHGDAYLQRAYMAAFDDLSAAEADYRRGLELSPNSAPGFAGLAAVVYQDPARRDEALELFDRARRIDPLEPGYDVRKSLFLFYERADLQGANDLLVEVLREHPRYVPALVRLCELRAFGMGRLADGVQYCEQALAIDPLSAEARLHLIKTYQQLAEPAAAEQVASEAGRDSVVPQTLLQTYAGDWVRAGEGAYDAIARRTASPTVIGEMIEAILMHARVTGDTRRARIAVEDVVHQEGPAWREGSTGMFLSTLLAAAMLLDGDQERARQLLDEAIARTNHEIRDLGRPEHWYRRWYALALALNGDREASIAALQRYANAGAYPFVDWQLYFELEPALATMRKDPRYQELERKAREHVAAERRELNRMRTEGLVPDRS